MLLKLNPDAKKPVIGRTDGYGNISFGFTHSVGVRLK